MRFVTEKDPVPSLPPLELFAVLGEGPYVHVGPEAVLGEGDAYHYYDAHQAQRMAVLSFWTNLKNGSLQDVPEHMMITYLRRIGQKAPVPAR